ncbi:type II toxin-antitoxin system VapB family antitoxin [Rhabdobacter roseus]|uniref:Arc/MetJ family transcription regulator n=1 Tax=Rhabdobacter roseus TaxID=1655419 RepID=A0A840U3E1_9BACT|nr:type II toxin-antitoxin system VapB family antitoxin [Rhabdobacter roseus]MBB5286359.1 Arc/MetJ family transcription regulator [Rhabdobacter roseus]
MRTNVDIDEEKIEKIRRMNRNLKTKKDIINKALDEFIASMHRQSLLSLRGKVEWEGDINAWRTQDVKDI